MRILADTNLYISYLLNPGRTGAVKSLFQAAIDGQITLLLPQALLAEVVTAATTKPHLAQRIDTETLNALLTILSLVAEEIPRIDLPLPRYSRDRKDDYLIAYAIVGGADFLVTGDKDLLVLDMVGDLPIITAQELISTHL